MKIVAGIVLYNPDINRLKENINAILSQVEEIVVVDNGSTNIKCIEYTLHTYTNISLIRNKNNLGIAKALNQICEFAKRGKYTWVLSLDQDSVVQDGLVDAYTEYLENNFDDVAMLTCYIQDRNFEYESEETIKNCEVKFCITSASLLRIADWEKIGKYDEALFIDRVDTDLCHRLVVSDKKIIKIAYRGLLHEIGEKTTIKHILGRSITVFNHSPFRLYYIVRNCIYYAFKHRKTENFFATYCAAYNRILIVLFFESNKIEKIKRGLKGIIDGHKMIIRMMK